MAVTSPLLDLDVPLVALTVRQPWVWAILAGVKRVENRSWRPRPELIGCDTLLHAGARLDVEGVETVTRLAGRAPDVSQRAGIVGIVRVVDVVTSSHDPWFMGPLGWILDDVRALPEPVPCAGRLMLWTPPRDVLRAVARQIAA